MISTQYMYGIWLKTRNVQFSWKKYKIDILVAGKTKEIYISKDSLVVIISLLIHVQLLLFINQYYIYMYDSLHATKEVADKRKPRCNSLFIGKYNVLFPDSFTWWQQIYGTSSYNSTCKSYRDTLKFNKHQLVRFSYFAAIVHTLTCNVSAVLHTCGAACACSLDIAGLLN